mmetsp:Transcript_4435/g.9656  ORF Transcript_4435/g.9656 Transcript_4435/m.9656 type:complete len:217 (-) Transcript_4435:12-662(-)
MGQRGQVPPGGGEDHLTVPLQRWSGMLQGGAKALHGRENDLSIALEFFQGVAQGRAALPHRFEDHLAVSPQGSVGELEGATVGLHRGEHEVSVAPPRHIYILKLSTAAAEVLEELAPTRVCAQETHLGALLGGDVADQLIVTEEPAAGRCKEPLRVLRGAKLLLNEHLRIEHCVPRLSGDGPQHLGRQGTDHAELHRHGRLHGAPRAQCAHTPYPT